MTTFGSATQLQASILTADLAAPGIIPVTVLNPNGSLSNAMTFQVQAAVPTYTDNFNRTNQSPLQGNWVAWDSGLGTLELYNNQLRSTDMNPYNVWGRRPNEPYSTNHYSQIKLTSIPTGEIGGPAVRVKMNGSEINGYILTVLNPTTAAIWVRYSTGIWQQVGTNFTGTFTSGDVYKLAINGNVLTVSRNGVSLGTRTDANNRVPSGGAAGVSVVYPGSWDDWQGGDTSGTLSPAITSISPTFVTTGGPALTLTVSGSNFVSGSKVRWNGSDRVTTFVSATQLRANILAADVATAGSVPVTVFNPDGSLSNAMIFEIRSPQPAVIHLTPSWGTAGGPSFTLIVDGSNFASGSKVRWKGSDRATSFITGTELQASISASDIASAGTAGVTVYTPPPGGGTSNAINFDILPVLASVTVNPSSVVGGSPSTGTVTMSGPAPAGGALVSLSSSNSPVASVPSSVTVAAGASSATFTITTNPVSGSTAVTISGLYGGVTRSASLTVLPVNIPSLTSLSLNPSSVMGGNGSTGTVTMSGPAPVGGAVVILSSNNPSVVSMPSTVTLAGGATNTTFPITTISVSSSTVVNVSAVYAGVTKTSVLTVNPSSLSSLSLSPSAIVGGNTSRGTVTLNGPAPSGGAVVSLASNNTSAATVPTSVTVASGNASATFTITTNVVASSRAVNISSLYGGVTRSATLTVLPENSPSVGHGITPWPENKSGAVSLTFDDGETSQYTLGVPALNARGLKGSFYIITEYAGVPLDAAAWNSWRNAAVVGHEIGSHSKTHTDLTQLSPAQLQDEVVGSKVTIDAQITTQKTRSFVYPFGYFNSSVMSIVQDNYIAARGVNCTLNDEPFEFYNVSGCTPDDLTLDIYALTDAAEQQRKWLVLYFHSLLGAIENGWGSYEIGMFTTYLDYLQQKNLWVGTFGSAVKYLKERSSATLSVYSSSSDQMVLSLSDSLDDSIYNQPLTLRSEVPSAWTTVKIEQGSGSIELPSILEGTTRAVYYNVLPDGGLITLRNPQVGNPQITALAPQYVTSGGPAFTLTVSGSNFVSGSKVRWNGSDRVTTFVSATQLRANILAADVATAGSVPVTVFNPDGSLSNAMIFEIRSPQPAVIHLTPSWGTAGGPSFTLIVDGSNFASGSKVRWKGSDRATSFITGTELQASISASDIASAGTAGVTVYTPPPGGGTSNAINFDILPVLASVTVNPSSVVGGSPSTGTVTLSGPAPVGGALVSLSSSDNTSAATVPASVTVAAGASSATFTITTNPVSGSTAVNLSALYGGITRSAPLTVTPVAAGLSSLGVNPSSVVGGSPSTGTVTLTGPAPVGGALVSLSSDNTSAATVPASVTVAAGASSATFTITTSPVSGSTAVNLSALYGGITRSAPLTVTPVAAGLSSLGVNPSSVVGGSPSTGTVTLSGPAPVGGALVSLSSDNTSAATVPASVTVAAGASSATFTITTNPVSGSTAVNISALYGGITRTAPLTVTPVAAGLSSLGVNPSSVVGGSPSTGTVTLSGPAPVGGALVSLSSDNTLAATVPASVTVAAGASSATFTITTNPVSGSTAVNISALYGGITRTAPLTVTPVAAVLSSLGVNPSSVVGGSPSTGTVTLSGPAPVGGALVSLSSDNTLAATVPASVTVAAGASSATFTITTNPVSGSTAVNLSALYGGITRTAPLTVTPVAAGLSSLGVNPSSVVGGSPSTGTVTLSGPAPVGGALVSLSSDNTLAATVPSSVTVAAGASSATFTITTNPVSGSTAVNLSALYGGVTRSAPLTVTPAAAVLSSLGVNPSSVVGGSPSTGTVTLSGPAPVGGALVSLSSDNTSAATVPASVTVAAGASSATFTITTNPVSGSTAVNISALYGGITRTAPLTVTPAAPVVTVLSPSVATAGGPAFTLTVSGSNFVSGSKVRWNGSDRVTTFGSATQLQASILTADLAAPGIIPVTVLNPNGSLSNAMTFQVQAAVPTYTDNFNRTNQSPLQGNWVAWDSGLGTLELYNNQLRSTDRNPYNVWGRRPNEPYSTNHYSQIKLTSIPTGEIGGPAVRVKMNGSEINGYILTVLNPTTAAIWVRYSTGIWQQVGTNFTGTFTSGDVYKLAINGNVLTVSRNGVSLGTRTDANNRVPSGGAAGVSVVYPGTWDDWQGGDTS